MQKLKKYIWDIVGGVIDPNDGRSEDSGRRDDDEDGEVEEGSEEGFGQED